MRAAPDPALAHAAPPPITVDWIADHVGPMFTYAPHANPPAIISPGHGEGMRDFSYNIAPGEYLICAVAAGGQALLTAPGETVMYLAATPAWITIAHPASADIQMSRSSILRSTLQFR